VISPFLGIDKAGGFKYIQEYTGFISPGVFCVFILGFFWKRATARAALVAILSGFVLSVLFKFGYPDMPFIDRMGWVFLICVGLMVVISLTDPKGTREDKLQVEASMFRTHPAFTVGVLVITGILAALYLVFEQQG